MPDPLHLYVDDSGNRNPDTRPGQNTTPRWFGLGGILIRESEERSVRESMAQLRGRWTHYIGDAPLHSYKIRQQKGSFGWMQTDPEAGQTFVTELSDLISAAPILCTACVIDRPGYMARYLPKYDVAQRWKLCKTAFSVLLERVAKYAKLSGSKVRVFVERSDKITDGLMRTYYDDLRMTGMPFDQTSMAGYGPLDPTSFRETLYDFKPKDKTSSLMQLADLCLFPMCRAGYDRSGRDYIALRTAGKLLDQVLAPGDVPTLGIKYSCFD